MRKTIQIITLGIILLSSCSKDKKNVYTEEVKQNFMNSCVNAGATQGLCSCIFEKVQVKYTLEEFSIIEVKMKMGQTPTEFLEFAGKVRVECMKK